MRYAIQNYEGAIKKIVEHYADIWRYYYEEFDLEGRDDCAEEIYKSVENNKHGFALSTLSEDKTAYRIAAKIFLSVYSSKYREFETDEICFIRSLIDEHKIIEDAKAMFGEDEPDSQEVKT